MKEPRLAPCLINNLVHKHETTRVSLLIVLAYNSSTLPLKEQASWKEKMREGSPALPLKERVP